jgi:UDP-N-acetylglucosamine 2-epimerase (non-hydrolysing)
MGATLRVKYSIILGTRPEIIKLSPVIRECERLGLDFFILHSGQHYSYNMDRVFFEQLELPDAKYSLEVGSGTHAEQTSRILVGVEKIIQEEKPDVVLVEGDTNTVLAGALASAKLGIKVGHVEAGLRSYDRQMPEEINRRLTDHCSDFLFAPTEKTKRILLAEGIPEEKIFVTGNTIVDAVLQNLEVSKRKGSILRNLGLEPNGYFLTTVHRQENVDSEERFKNITEGLELLQERTGLPIIYPIHPRAKKQLSAFNIKLTRIGLIDPLDYLNFLQVESNAKLILTDSGGVQEEACLLRIPCVTLRYNTERPETLDVGANVLAGTNPREIVRKAEYMLNKKGNSWMNPFGDGKTGERIVQILKERLA